MQSPVQPYAFMSSCFVNFHAICYYAYYCNFLKETSILILAYLYASDTGKT
jgi:hypothetical protein